MSRNSVVIHPWHGVSPGKNIPYEVNAIIEIPKGSKAKYELDKESGLIKLDRILYSSVHYPVNYGFIPQTLGDDNDPLDILVLCTESLLPGCLVEAKVIGVMQMLDNGEGDDKIIGVASKDISVSHIRDMESMPPHLVKEIKNFFEEYKKLENKEVLIEDIKDAETAVEIVQRNLQDYKNRYGELSG